MIPSLVCQDLTKDRSGFRLGPVNLTLAPGVTCLVGANGAGKSTLMRLVLGLDTPTSGGISRSGTVGYMPQELSFPAVARASDYLRHVAMLVGVSPDARVGAVDDLLTRVGLADRADSRIGALSGGMRRRLGLAQALLGGPAVLMLDEPTVGLDPLQRVEMRHAIARASADRIALISTHLVEDVTDLADRVLVMRDGQVVADGRQDEVVASAPGSVAGVSLERAISALMAGAPRA